MRDIFDKATTSDVGNAVYQLFFDERQDSLDIDTSRPKKNSLSFLPSNSGRTSSPVKSAKATDERVTIEWNPTLKQVRAEYLPLPPLSRQ